MTKPSRDANQRWLGLLLAALVAVLVTLFGAGTASAATATAAQTRVGPHTLVTQVVVGPDGGIGAGQRLGNDLPAYDSALATGVAAKSAAELPEGYRSFSAAKRALGSPGEGNVFDHVVEQSQIKRSGFAPEEIHNPFNMNPVSAGANQLKANYYSTKQGFTGGRTVRDWLNGQSFADQYEFGMDSVNKIQNGLPLP